MRNTARRLAITFIGGLALAVPVVAGLPFGAPPLGLSAAQATAGAAISGRWEFTYETQAAPEGRGGVGAGEGRAGRGAAGAETAQGDGGRARGGVRGGGGAAGPAAPAGPPRTRVVMNLKAGPANTITGDVSSGQVGRRGGAPVPVEISDGRFDGSRFSFKVWVVDGFTNRANYEGRLLGDTLEVSVTRDTPTGVQKVADGTATRVRR